MLISREEKSRLLSSTRDESRDSAFFSLNNTSHCLSPELSQPVEANEQKIESSTYEEEQVETTLPKPLYLEVPCPTQSLLTCSIMTFSQVPSSSSSVRVQRNWVWRRLKESLANDKSRLDINENPLSR